MKVPGLRRRWANNTNGLGKKRVGAVGAEDFLPLPIFSRGNRRGRKSSAPSAPTAPTSNFLLPNNMHRITRQHPCRLNP